MVWGPRQMKSYERGQPDLPHSAPANAAVLHQPHTLASLAFQSELNTSDCPRNLQAFNAKLAQLLGLSIHWGSQPLQHEDRHCSINPFIIHNYTTYV